MASSALTAFGTEIDKLDFYQKDKDGLKLVAERFYIASIKEGADHIERHLDAAITDNPGNTDLKAKAELIRTWLEKVRLDDANLALSIHEGLEPLEP